MIQDELCIQKAKDLKIEVPDAEITPHVDRQVRETRARISRTSREFRNALQKASLGTPEEYRRYLMEQFRRQLISRRLCESSSRTARSFRST